MQTSMGIHIGTNKKNNYSFDYFKRNKER
uniref:Uncharacterized protein n=1 Tax=Heterorhabditis bacteriophora TaxID=37862 RepID=A0A1I7WCG8_HETBA